ncbi:hypothetical protein Landi51_09061 [Colletotrichum acutatum]
MPTEGLKKPRAKHACRECNSRRIRCNVTERHPCSNCETAQATCEVIPSRRGRYLRKSKRQKQTEAAASATPEPAAPAASSALTADVAATLASMSTVSPSHGLPSSSGISQTPFHADTPASCHSSGTTGGSRFFGESNFITLVPGASGPGNEAATSDGLLKGRLTFPVPQTPQSHGLATSPASVPSMSSATERYLRDEGALTFPDMQSCLPALHAYFTWFHPCFPILDRADISRRLVTMDISPLLLQAMLFIGSTYCDEATILGMGFKDRSEAKNLTYSRARVLFHANWEKDEFTLIQSLFLCSFWRGGPADWRDVRYWLGAVLTLAQTHGLHRSTRFITKDPHFARMRRRVWWSIYVRERQAAVSLGLPCRIRDEDCDIEPLTSTDLEDDADEQRATGFGAPESEHIHYAVKMIDIARLLGRIMDTHFAPGRGPPAPTEVRELKQQLEDWKQSLPDEMRRGPDDGQSSVLTCLIHLAYNHLRILVHRNGWLRNRDQEDKSAALAAACRISRIAEDMLAQKTLQYGQMHLLTSLFAAFCIHAIDIKSADGISRRLAEHRAQMCLLGLKEIQKYWRINNNVLDLFLQYLDESIAKRLNGDSTESAPSSALSSSITGLEPFNDDAGTSPPVTLLQDALQQARPDAMEDQYFSLMRTNWEGEDALEDLGLFLDPQLYANGPMQVEGLNFLQRYAAAKLLDTFAGKDVVRKQLLDSNQLQRLSLTLNRKELHPGVDVSSEAPAQGTPLPPGYHLVYFTPTGVESELGMDGTDKTFNAPAPFTRRMWAGGKMQFVEGTSLKVGEVVEARTRLVGATPKKSKSGDEMVLVDVEKEFYGNDGLVVKDQRSWIFRPEVDVSLAAKTAPPRSERPPAFGPSTITDQPSAEGGIVRHFRWSPVGLFRFSALTFNGHMIHYNEPWTKDIERHPEVVVHGPLNLINMLDYWRDVHGKDGREARQVTYRAMSPLYAGDKYTLRTAAVENEERNDLLIEKGNIVCMKGEIIGS